MTDDGLPYLAMDYVDDQPVTAWCAARDLPIRERLALFRTICDAVRFAHANLVVHRDRKPQNILVAGDGRPILLDFGIAKLLDPEEGEAAATLEEERALTPEHVVPEQLRGDLDRIVMRALRKEPERRYRSAEDLAEDVDHWLAGLPVRATPGGDTLRVDVLVRMAETKIEQTRDHPRIQAKL